MSFNKFHQRVAAKAADNSAPPVLTVALGDSVTQGWMEYGRLDPEGVYHHQLQRLLEARHPCTTFSTINAGNGGEGAPGGLSRLDRDVLRHDPDLVLIAYGLNDANQGAAGLADFAETLAKLVSRVRDESCAGVVLLTPNMMLTRENPAISERYQQLAPSFMRTQRSGILAAYARAIRDIGATLNVPVADVYAAWEQRSINGEDITAWLANGLNHPIRELHALTAGLIFGCIKG